MKTSIREFLLALVLLSSFTRSANAQYMYLDVNGDSLNTSSDRLNGSGQTVLTILLNTNHDRDGSSQSCNSHSVACPQVVSLSLPVAVARFTYRQAQCRSRVVMFPPQLRYRACRS